MSVDLQHELTRAAPDPIRDVDVAAVRGRARQLNRRRRVGGVVAAVLVVAVGVLGVEQLTGSESPPVVGPAPSGPAETADGAWQHASVGQTLTLPANAWGSEEIGSLEPARSAEWDPAVAAVVAAVGDDLSTDIDRTVGPDGSVLLVPRDPGDDPRLIAIGPEGAQRVVEVPGQVDHMQAGWSPGGHWLLLATNRDGAAIVHEVSAAGQILASVPVDGHEPPSGDGTLVVHDGEVWVVWSGDESSAEPVPQAAQLTTDGGGTVVDPLDWQPSEQAGVQAPVEATGMGLVPSRPNTTPRLVTTESGTDRVLLENGQVTVDAGAPQDTQHLITLAARNGDRWALADGSLRAATHQARYATVLLADSNGVWITGFVEVARAAAVHIDPDGRPWFLQVTADGYGLTDLTPPDTVGGPAREDETIGGGPLDEDVSVPPSDQIAQLEQQLHGLETEMQEASAELAQLRTVESELQSRESDGENVDDERATLTADLASVRRRIEDLADRRLDLEQQLASLGALEDPVAMARVAVADDDRAIADALMTFARDPTVGTAEAVPFASSVELGLGPDLTRQIDIADIADPSAWVFDASLFRARDGDLSALEHLSQDRVVQLLVGEHPHCASPPMPAPDGYDQHRRLSIQPLDITSCIEWWTVDLFVDNGRVDAVSLDLWEP